VHRSILRWPLPLSALLLLALLSRAAGAATPVVRAADVLQPDGWDHELALPQPEDLNPDPRVLEIELEAKIVELELTPGHRTKVWTYNGLLPGPYIRAAKGDRLVVHFRNSLPDATTIHWHGVRVSNDMDGTPGLTQPLVQPGGTFTYDFVLRDAGTYWYHPHADSAAQVGFGLYGPIVVTDPADPAAFGDDLVLMVSDMSLDKDHQLLPKTDGGNFGDLFGREGDTLLVNGRVMPTLLVRQGKPQRWRIINAARTRYWTFALRNTVFTRLGGDNGLAGRPEKLPRITISPGERMDLSYTPAVEPGTTQNLRWLAYDRGYGTTVNRIPENIMAIRSVPDEAVLPEPVPDVLRKIPPVNVAGAVQHTLDLTINLDGDGVEMGINGVPHWDAKPLVARLGEKHVWTIVNNSAFDHPFHLHGYFFQVLDDRRVPEWKDTVNVPVKSQVRIAIDFDERPGAWMYHCHILDHAEVGMMGTLQVLPKGAKAAPAAASPHAGHPRP
jgi:FtsP/CotA-like multicopper oxidase with cupredoxin domain